jgi:DNA-binding transcriptional LysR family regulator
MDRSLYFCNHPKFIGRLPGVIAVEPRDLEYFAVVAQYRNLGRAAEVLDLSQPALSKSLRRLETWAQMKIVKRTHRGVELTAAGHVLLKHAQRLHLSLDDIEHEVADLRHGQAGHLRAGADIFAADHLMPTACAAFCRAAPKATAKVTVGDIDVLLSALRRGDLDLIVTTIPAFSREDVVQKLFDQEFAVYASAGHRLAKRKRVTIEDLVSEKWAVPAQHALSWQAVVRAFANAGLPPPITGLETSSIAIKLKAVACTDLLGFTGTRVLRRAAATLPLVDLRVREMAWSVPVGVRYRKDAYLSAAAQQFIEILKATSRDFAAGRHIC